MKQKNPIKGLKLIHNNYQIQNGPEENNMINQNSIQIQNRNNIIENNIAEGGLDDGNDVEINIDN